MPKNSIDPELAKKIVQIKEKFDFESGHLRPSTENDEGIFSKCANYQAPSQAKSLGIYPYFREIEKTGSSHVVIDGKDVTMSTADYLAAVSARASKKIKKEDAICTASMMTVEGILLGIKILNINFKSLILTGGGRNNLFIVKNLKKIFKSKRKKIILVDELNFNGDFLEAQAFAYLAVRCVRKLPLSLPTTTGVKKPISGGLIYQ